MASHPQLLHTRFEALEGRSDVSPRVWCRGVGWTSSSINNRANQLATALSKLNLKSGDNVGVLLPRSVDHLIATLAIFKVGATAVPLDVEYPRARTQAMIRHASVKVVICMDTDSNLEVEHAVLPLSHMRFQDSSQSDPPLGSTIDPDSTAYLIFTTGTTGTTKAVRLSHSQLVLYAETYAEQVGLHSDSQHVYALFASFCFVAHLKQVWAPLLAGSSVVIIPESARRSASEFAHLVHQHQITAFDVVPGFLYRLVNDWRQGLLPRRWDCSVRMIGTSGDTLPTDLVHHVSNLASNNIDLINLYGITESCGIAAAYHLSLDKRHLREGSGLQQAALVPVGFAMPGATIYLLNVNEDDGTFEIVGQQGSRSNGFGTSDQAACEIFVTGPRVGRGYLTDPAEVSRWPNLRQGLISGASFMFDAITRSSPPQAILRTFDVGYYDPSGALVHVGRKDDMFKILGVKLSPSEIAGHIEQAAFVREAAVYYHAPRAKLIAFVVIADRQLVSEAAGMSSPPLGTSGGIDEQGLPEWWLEDVRFSPLDRSRSRTLTERLRQVLPTVALPNHFVIVSSGEKGQASSGRIPRSGQQKVDRRSLARWADHCLAQSALLNSPALPSLRPAIALSDQQKGEGHHVLMTQIKSVVQEVLGDIDIDDEADFLGLGMTSLTASEIARRLSEIIGCAISTSLVYEHPSVQELIAALPERAEILGAVTEATASPRSIPRRHEKYRLDDTTLPMSFAQERIWVHHQALSEFDSKIKTDGEERNQTAMLNVTRTFVLYGPLNLVALQQALRFLVERHEILHTKFKFDHNTSQPTQVIVSDRSTYEFDNNNSLLSLSSKDLPAAIRKQIRLLSNATFNLATGPLVRVTVLPLEPSVNILNITVHHIITDGWSTGQLLAELSDVYKRVLNGESDAQLWTAHPRPSIHYADYAAHQRSSNIVQALRQEATLYWALVLANHEPLDFPTDFPRGPTTMRGDSYRSMVNPQLLEAIKARARENRVSIFSFLMSTFMILLARYSGQTNICTGTYTANRGIAPSESMLGCFINAIPYVHHIDPVMQFDRLLREINQKSLAALDHQHVPFEMMLDDCKSEARNLGDHPIFQTALVLQNQRTRSAFALHGTTVREVYPQNSYAKLDLCFIIEEKQEEPLEASNIHLGGSPPVAIPLSPSSPYLELRIEFNTDLFHRLTVVNITETWLSILEFVARDSATTIRDIPHLPPKHHDLTIHQFNRRRPSASLPNAGDSIEGDDDDTLLIHKLEEHANRKPQKTAIRWHVNELILKTSYGELNDRADRLAIVIDRFYKQLKSETESVTCAYQSVILCTGQNPIHLTGLLGIIKSGRPYVPVDPTAPADRIAGIVGQCGARLMVCDEGSKSLLESVGTTAKLLTLDSEFWSMAEELKSQVYMARELTSKITAQALAYIIFTSGSTGAPKGCLNHHGGLTNTTKHLWPPGTADTSSRFIQAFSPAFDGHVSEWASALWFGGSLCIPESRQMLLGEGFRRTLNRFKVTHVLSTPSMLSSVPVGPMPSLKVLMIGAEAVPRQLIDKWMPVLNPIGEARCVVQNVYGPTECAIVATKYPYSHEDAAPDDTSDCDGGSLRITRHPAATVGRPLVGATIYILDDSLRPCPIGGVGEVFIGGKGVGSGYLGLPEQTAAKFLPNPWHGGQMYRTGDLARWLGDGTVHMFGRKDNQVKVRGHRIELEEIETALTNHYLVADCKVLVQSLTASPSSDNESIALVAFVALRNGASSPKNWISELRTTVASILPPYMCPSRYHAVDQIPKTINGKVNTKELEQIHRRAVEDQRSSFANSEHLEASTESLEAFVIRAFRKVLHVEHVTIHDDFFELGGNSLLALQLAKEFPDQIGRLLSAHHVFRHRTVTALASFIEQQLANDKPPPEHFGTDRGENHVDADYAAIVGISILAPGCTDAATYWADVLSPGVDCLSRLTKEQLIEEGTVSRDLLDSDSFVAVMGRLGRKENPVDVFGFDASLFGMKDANAVALMDPQHRQFLQAAWHALEDAAIPIGNASTRIGVFASCGTNNYVTDYLARRSDQPLSASQRHRNVIANDKDFIALQTSYALNLTGPAMVVQSACSSSLAAVHSALSALRGKECEAAIAGGVSLGALHQSGYVYEPGTILAEDGVCRPFAEDACGTVRGAGVCAVVLKPLRDAVRDKDRIYAVIRGSAMNNDGCAADKASFMAPSVTGQSAGLQAVLQAAGLRSQVDSIGMWECHATGTRVGDPVEVEAMRTVFAGCTANKGICAIGSVKSQIGHLDAAAGVAGLIKAALSIYNAKIPPTIHVDKENEDLGLEDSAFYLNLRTRDWPEGQVRRAGVTSLGMGGTNIYQVLEEAPTPVPNKPAALSSTRKIHILPFSTRSQRSAHMLAQTLAKYLNQEELRLSSVAFTMQKRRSHRIPSGRGYVIANTTLQASEAFEWLGQHCKSLETDRPTSRFASLPEICNELPRKVIFMFAGQGTHYSGMGVTLYDNEPLFRKHVDALLLILQDINAELRFSLAPLSAHDLWDSQERGTGEQPLHIVALGLFILQMATAKSFMELSINPAVVLGHSLGQYTAACVAGIMSEETAMRILTKRALLMDNMREGAMLSICGPRQQAMECLDQFNEECDRDHIDIAAFNSPSHIVVAAAPDTIARFQAYMKGRATGKDLETSPLRNHKAFHSHHVEDIREELESYLQGVEGRLVAPNIPIACNITGRLITSENALELGILDANYWYEHSRKAVRFGDCLQSVLSRDKSAQVWIEIGPGGGGLTLLNAVKRTSDALPPQVDQIQALPSFRDNRGHTDPAVSSIAVWSGFFASCIARCWQLGVNVDWGKLYNEGSEEVCWSLPKYPFDMKRYVVDGIAGCTAMKKGGKNETSFSQVGSVLNESSCAALKDEDLIRVVREMLARIAAVSVQECDVYRELDELGVDSLAVSTLASKVVEQFQSRLQPEFSGNHGSKAEGRLKRRRTISGMASELKGMITRSEEAPGPSEYDETLYQLNDVVGDSAMVLVHGIGGDTVSLGSFARKITVCPAYVIRALSIDGEQPPFFSIPDMASAYVDMIMRKPELREMKSLILGGYSFGGAVALEMARQMSMRPYPIPVTTLIQLDSPIGASVHRANPRDLLKNLLPNVPTDYISLLDLLFVGLEEPEGIGELIMKNRELLPKGVSAGAMHTLFAHYKALTLYDAEPASKSWGGNLIFVRVMNGLGYQYDFFRSWMELAFARNWAVDVHQMPSATHNTMFSGENLVDLVAYINQKLNLKIAG